jgi:hypothetical protein
MKTKKAGGRSAADTSFNRRLLRSIPTNAFNRRLLRSSPDAFSRRLLKRSGKRDTFARRLLRSGPSSAFNRRLLRSDPSRNHQLQPRSVPDAFKRRILKKSTIGAGESASTVEMMKRQSLIPFPRTGKRSDPEVALPVLQEMDSLQGGLVAGEEALEPVEDMLMDFLEDDEDDYTAEDNEEANDNED